jgi:type IV pilus assembly protein PilO
MATPFREWPWPLQALLSLVLGVVVVLVGLYLPYSPVRARRLELDQAKEQLKPLQADVDRLRVYDQRRAELQGKMEALQKQLATLQTIVPEEKQLDQFILMVQGAAASSNVSIRHLTAKPIVAREYHYEMPFEIEADGPYYSVLDFFAKLSRLSRIINVGDLTLSGTSESSAKRVHMAPNTTVTGTFTVITFFTKPADHEAATPPQAPAKR